ncbi:hypothetical protein PHYBLDRAFT_75904, partial [Phycomyces blakesleeanus NRRL 1555(-)]
MEKVRQALAQQVSKEAEDRRATELAAENPKSIDVHMRDIYGTAIDSNYGPTNSATQLCTDRTHPFKEDAEMQISGEGSSSHDN